MASRQSESNAVLCLDCKQEFKKILKTVSDIDSYSLNQTLIISQNIYLQSRIMSDNKQNLKRFKFIFSNQYIQIIPQLPTFSTQILIHKRTSQIIFEPLDKVYEFGGQCQTKFGSLVLGIVQIQGENFLVYVESVYIQKPFPIDSAGVYQIAEVQLLEFGPFVSPHQREVFSTMQTQIFNFAFYFSFRKDLTLSMQKSLSPSSSSQDPFFWNLSMLKAMMTNQVAQDWLIPVIQGHYNGWKSVIQGKQIRYWIISRRSKYRSGTRFYNRGIDQNSKCSQFIETEQIVEVGNQLTSYVALSGSVPIFWQQKSQSDKIKLTRNKELTTIPFLGHFNEIKRQFDRVFIVNLLEKKKENENLLLQAYEQLIDQNQNELKDFCRYMYFDINEVYKKQNYIQMFQVLSSLDPIIKEFGYFRMTIGNPVSQSPPQLQSGIFRISCLDCLSRTNNFMQALNFFVLWEQFWQIGLVEQHCSKQMIKSLLIEEGGTEMIGLFRSLWIQKADFESMIYTGSRATNGRKNKFLDDLQDSFISLQRLYNQKFMDRIKQKSLDIILHHKNYNFDTLLIDKHKSSFSIAIMTWNVNATSFEKMVELSDALQKCKGSDLIVIGIQEMIELSTGNVVNNNEQQSQNSVKWGKGLEKLLQNVGKYIFVQKIQMVGILAIVFVNQSWKHGIKSVQKDTVKTGMGGQLGNKGAVVLRIKIFQTSLCFMCAHLAAGFSKTKERIDDFLQIHKKAFQQNKLGVQNQKEVEYSDYKFFFGDLNFRVQGQFKDIKQLVDNASTNEDGKQQVIQELLTRDQLSILRKDSSTPYLLTYYNEHSIHFLPTYKLEKNTGNYTLEKSRNPSWCDRIMYWSNEGENDCECIEYSDIKIKGSDHRPVIGRFKVTISKEIEKDAKIQQSDPQSP